MSSNEKYLIYDLSQELSAGAVEHRGSKLKEWITYTLDGQELRILFKEGRFGTGENWSEKVTSEFADLLELPHAKYDFGYLGNDKYCVICPKFLEDNEEFIPGNQLIEGFDLNKRFKNPTYTIDGILTALRDVTKAQDLFIGYLCFDALISNTDRHDENWGIIDVNNIKILAPTFDHASSLGRNESDESRIKRMTTTDTGYDVKAYIRKAMTPIYDENSKKLNTISVVEACKKRNPEMTKFWVNKIINVMSDEQRVRNILDKVPDQLISEPARDFAMAMLKQNVELLKGLQND